jgi:imidazole glycerol-phosphate synthase subunit HisH
VTPSPVIIGSCGANLASLKFALARLGADAPVTTDPAAVRAASHVILPGVGAARPAMEKLAADGLAGVVPTLTQPVLGICLGMQLLFGGSDEDDVRCLGIIDAQVRRLPQSAELPVPQMGWNQVRATGVSPLLEGIGDGAYAYFIHSYAAPLGTYVRATADYGGPFAAVVEQRNFYGTQFHPERSSHMGAKVLANFLRVES